MTVTNQQLFDKAEEAWARSWEWHYHPATGLFYDYVASADHEQRLQYLPTPEEIARQYPNPRGWGTGMEDSSISGGLLLAMVCDRYAVTGEAHLREAARQLYEGLVLCATLSPSTGLILRSVSPLDRTSRYADSSRDQYTWHSYGLWRFSHSELASEAQRETIAQIMTAVCERLERNVRPGPTDYHLCREDGLPGLVDKMWEVDAHEVARLPMHYAIAGDLTGEQHWWEQAGRYAARAARESLQVPPQMRTPYAFLQEQVSVEALYLLYADKPEEQAGWLAALEFVAGRLAGVPAQCRQYQPLDIAALDMDWRHWELVPVVDGVVPRWPEGMRQEDAAVRQPGEALLAQLMCPTWTATEEWTALLARSLGQIDCAASVTYSLFYPLAAYWRAVRCGARQLP